MASNRRRATSRRGGGVRTKRRNRVLVRYPDSASARLRHQTKMHANPDADLRRFARLRAYAFEVWGDECARGSVRRVQPARGSSLSWMRRAHPGGRRERRAVSGAAGRAKWSTRCEAPR